MKKTVLVLALSALAFAADKWTVDDVLLTESAGQLEISKDGKMAVYVKSQMNKEKGENVSHLMLRHLGEGWDIQLTRGNDGASSPKFSPDSKKIAFLTSRRPADAPPTPPAGGEGGGGPQIWMLDVRGGEPYSVSRFERGVRGFAFLDNDTMLVWAAEDPSFYDQQVKEKKDTSNVVDDEVHAPPVRLFKFDLKSRKATRLSDNSDRIQRVVISPDSNWAVSTHDQSLRYIYDQMVRPATFVWDLKKGTSRQIFPDKKILPADVQWSPDSKGFYFTAPFTNHPQFMNASIERIYWFDVATGQHTEVVLDWERGAAGSMAAVNDGFITMLADGVKSKLAKYTRTGPNSWTKAMITGDQVANIWGFDLADDQKTMVYQYSTSSVPAQMYQAELQGTALVSAKPITNLNAGWKNKPLAKSEVVRWKGANNEEVEGILYYPHDYKAGTKVPLVAMIHGGPHGADVDSYADRWGYPVQLFAQRGAAVLKVNYHGSSRYGLAWGESIGNGKYNDLEWIDVEKGVDSMIARGLADPDKLGVMGWSNGSIITIELTTRTQRYKVASAGAGDVNWTSDWGNAVFGKAFEGFYMGKTPMEDPELYIKKSPLWRMDKVTTPTIIFFGTEDKQVPTEQGWQHYRALQHYNKTDVRFILFPGEAHGPRKYVHQRRKMDEELVWFDKYLFKTWSDKNEALKMESPLSARLKLKAAGDLPEVVSRATFDLGRFEVTRAQFKAFDPSYAVAPGTESYPASGVTFEQAQKYCEWLSKKTGQKFRLPKEEEAGFLTANRGENTLDGWAGYTVNTDDARRLAPLVDQLGKGALLKPVGSYAGSGEDPVYDLGGNVSEWVIAKDGTGKAMGGSADRPADAKTPGSARADYIGFRVVREK
jgi:dipeptidyl aminopeptidase/acylaminoacyl peptidase